MSMMGAAWAHVHSKVSGSTPNVVFDHVCPYLCFDHLRDCSVRHSRDVQSEKRAGRKM